MIAAPLLIVLATAGLGQTIPPKPDRWATDLTGHVSAPALHALDARLQAFDRLTGHQVLLWIGPLGGDAPESFATRAFDAWKPGRAGVDDGLVLFLFPDEHRSRIEVGYGLEAVVPDAVAGQVLSDVVAPRLRANDWDSATAAGMDALLVRIDRDAAAKAGATPPAAVSSPQDGGAPPAILVIAVILLLLFVRTRWGPALLWSFPRSGSSWGGTRGGGGSRGGGGGGGFSGGGGHSGGGGASGSW